MAEHDELESQTQAAVFGPWKRTSSRLAYDNPWIQVHHEDVITPAGTPGLYGRVHFKNQAIGIIPVDDEGNTWLVKQYRYTLQHDCWEIPMGGCSRDESPLEAGKRELEEEVGLKAAQWQQILFLHPSNSITDEQGTVFVARRLSAGQQALEDSESDLEVVKLPLKDAIQWALNGKITDAISVAGLLALAAQGG